MKNYLKFWGTRGSCSVSGPEYLHFGGNSCCLEMRYENTHIIFDAGTGIRGLGEALLKENVRKIDLILSHTHWDHLIGFPFFDPIYRKGVEITIWAPAGEGRTCHQLFDDLLSPEFFPVSLDQVQAKLEFKTIYEKTPIQIGDITLDFHRTFHPSLTFGFKIKTPHQTIGYITDNEIDNTNQDSFAQFFKNSDIFIHEAQYTPEEYQKKSGWGHSSLSDAIHLVNRINPGRWLVTHHDPKHTDADLKELEEIAQSSNLAYPVEWIPDGYLLFLK